MKRKDRCRAALGWATLSFLVLQGGAAIGIDAWLPEVRDPEFGRKLSLLTKRLTENSDRPLVLVLGSSRAEMGMRPDLFHDGEDPFASGSPSASENSSSLVFNFALSGSGPVQELLCLRRLLDRGIRPARLLVEVLPPLLTDAVMDTRIALESLAWEDFAVVDSYLVRPDLAHSEWRRRVCLPSYTHRFHILDSIAPAWLPWQCRQDAVLNNFDGLGWLAYARKPIPAEQRRRQTEKIRLEFEPRLQNFAVATTQDRALRDLLALCRSQGIGMTLFVMPEASEFRRLYPPGANERIEHYLDGLSRDFGVAVIDCRLWMEDGFFADSHHLLTTGAAIFSKRFGKELMRQKQVNVERAHPAIAIPPDYGGFRSTGS